MRKEWRRIFLNRGLVWGVVSLLAANLVLFCMTAVTSGAFSGIDATRKRMELLESAISGEVTLEELEEQSQKWDAGIQFFVLQRAKARDPEVYMEFFAPEEAALREAYPDLAADFDGGKLDEQAILSELGRVQSTVSALTYPERYAEKLDDIFDNADKLSSISIFQNSRSNANLRKTAQDFARMKGAVITPGNDLSIQMLTIYNLLPVFLGLFACVLVSQTLAEGQYHLRALIYSTKNGRGKLTLHRFLILLLASVLFSFLLYSSTIALSWALCGGFDWGRTAQSVEALFSITTPMNLGQFVLVYILWGMATQIMLTGVVWLVFSLLEQRQVALLALGGITGVSLLLYKAIPAQSILALLKYANPMAMIDFSGAIGVYRNVGFGDLLVEKTGIILASCAVVSLISLAAAARCGVQRYPVSSHGRLYAAVKHLLQRCSRIYHRGVSRLSLLGLELYKVLMMRKGILVAAALIVLLVQAYPVRPVTMVGSAQFMDAFYHRFGGQGYTEEVDAYVSELQEKLDGVERELKESTAAFQAGEITLDQFQAKRQKYAAYDVTRAGLASIRESAAYLRAQEAAGHSACFVDPTGYERLLNQSGIPDRAMALLSALAVMLLSAFLFPMERENGLYQMLRSTRRGRTYLARKKLTAAVILSTLIAALYQGARVFQIAGTFGLDHLDAPAHSLELFAQVSGNGSIGSVLALLLLSRFLLMGILAVVVCLLTQWMGAVPAFLAGTVGCVAPLILNGLGMRLPTIWDLADGVQNAILAGTWSIALALIALLAAAWKWTEYTWEKRRYPI